MVSASPSFKRFTSASAPGCGEKARVTRRLEFLMERMSNCIGSPGFLSVCDLPRIFQLVFIRATSKVSMRTVGNHCSLNMLVEHPSSRGTGAHLSSYLTPDIRNVIACFDTSTTEGHFGIDLFSVSDLAWMKNALAWK